MYDIFFISADATSDVSFNNLKKRFPLARKVSSFTEAQKKTFTKFFWIVWDNIEINDFFNFNYVVSEWNKNDIHVFKNGEYYDGVCLFPKTVKVSEREVNHRFFVNKKEVDIQASTPKKYDRFYINTYEEYLEAIEKTTTDMFWIVPSGIVIDAEFAFDYHVPFYDTFHRNITHVFKNGEYYDGLCLFPTSNKVSKKEFDHRFFVNKKEVDIQASTPKEYDRFYINTYEEYLEAIEKTATDMFWVVWDNIVVDKNFAFDYYIPTYDTFHRNITHVFKNGEYYDGICLFPKYIKVTKKEFDHRFFVNKKEVEIEASVPAPYDIFHANTYEEYLEAIKNTTTEMFWIIPNDVVVNAGFAFDYYVPTYDIFHKNITHIFKNGEYYDGLCLFPKRITVSKREFNYRFFVDKKEVDIQASIPAPFDVVFISYNEPNADENWNDLLLKVPKAKRIHGVKGIHNAHIAAAKIATTPMFWVVDGDAKTLESFNFNYQVPVHNYDSVYVWKSRNPINDLEYGYGGIKLLPRALTRKLDTRTTDMTTSISSKFNAVNQVSNVTVFNTDEFNTWKSAFRECVKLSSRVIDGQITEESENRLNIWCSQDNGAPYGKMAIAGAKAGRKYGQENAANPAALYLINDFDWLTAQFNLQ